MSKWFRTPKETIRSWLIANSYSGNLDEGLLAYFKTKSGISTGTLSDHIHKTLTDLGFTGSLQDKLNLFFETKQGTGNARESEDAFWADTSSDFSLVEADSPTHELSFDGTDIASLASPNLTLSGDFTICLRYKVDDLVANYGIFAKAQNPPRNYFIFSQITTGALRHQIWDGTNAATINSGNLTAGVYHSVVAVFDKTGNNELLLYVNAEAVQTADASAVGTITGTGQTELGDTESIGRLKGDVKSLVIYDGTVLDATQAADYIAGNIPSGATSKYVFDGNSPLVDSVGGKNLTVTGAAWVAL